ncbi:MAG: isocitrate/isopropylmalate family dehydrogenase [Methanomassiliicoccaceae archaeon]|nr:isocitrate/isopropylmalate family dehydrogenase [Methanomassiliicoccaceae archaeon]
MAKKVLALPGDGIGPEVTSSAVGVLEHAAGGRIEVTYGEIGLSALARTSEHLPAETVGLAADADAIISGGAAQAPSGRAHGDPVRELKRQLNLYSVVRKFFPLCDRIGVRGVDLLVVTGNPDALLHVSETESLDGVDLHKFLSSASCRKLFGETVRISASMGRRKVTCAHRASMFPTLDGMFVDEFYKCLAGAGLLVEDMEVGEAASRLVMDPPSMDVIVSTDIYGAVLAGVAAGMVGGGYLTPVGSIGDSCGLFEPMHGPNPRDVAGGAANPTSAILSGAMALDHLGMPAEAEKIRKAVRCVYSRGAVTPDVGGSATTKEFTESVIKAVEEQEEG